MAAGTAFWRTNVSNERGEVQLCPDIKCKAKFQCIFKYEQYTNFVHGWEEMALPIVL